MMSPSEREAWLELRKTGIGGSEVAALLSDEIETKYACKRRLWLEKSGVVADEEFNDTAPVRLGRLFEGPICDLYSHITGRRVEEIPRQVHPDHPELGVSVDRIAHDPEKGPIVVEAKAMLTRSFFSTKRDGIIPDYLAQVMHGILVASAALDIDIQYGSFVVGRSDDPKLVAFAVEWHLKMNPQYELNPGYLIHFDVPRNQEICDAILRKGNPFWKTLGQQNLAPDRLEIDSPKCQRCRWAIGCQGAALAPADTSDPIPVVDDLMPLAAEYLDRRVEFDRAEELLAETKEIISLMLGERQAAYVHIGEKLRPIYFRQQEGKPLYADAVKNMGAQYTALRDKLIKMEEAGNPAATGASLIPPASSFIRKGKPSRPLMLQYLSPKVKEEE
jgi:hypothetical protein